MTVTANVFSRFPARGQVKTRLARDLGDREALAWHRRMTAHTIRVAQEARGCHPVLWSAGPHWHSLFRPVPRRDRRVQPPGDLGARMAAALHWSLAQGRAGLVLGTDCPDLAPEHLEAAAAALAQWDLVLGPAHDGGYYLVGLRRRAPLLFRQMPWGTPAVLGETLRRARRAGLRFLLLDTLTDVDHRGDLAAVARVPGRA